MRSLSLEEAVFPDLLLCFPVHKLAAFNRTAKRGFTPLGDVGLLTGDICSLVPGADERVLYHSASFESI